MTNNIYWMLKAEVPVDNLAALKQIAPTFCELTLNEPGALAYEWSLSDDAKHLHVFERYADSNAALAHLGNVGAKLPDLLALVSVTAIECYGSANETFKDTVKDLPVVYHKQFAGFCR